MKRILTLFLFLIFSTLASAEGAYGTYTIVGTAYGPDSVSLKNVELKITFGKQSKIVKTNARGAFEIEIEWSTACPSGLTGKQIVEENAKMNPEYIYVSYKDKALKIKNTWEKYTSSAANNVKKKHDLMY